MATVRVSAAIAAARVFVLASPRLWVRDGALLLLLQPQNVRACVGVLACGWQEGVSRTHTNQDTNYDNNREAKQDTS